jgi:serine/threonine protein kinase
MEDSGTASLTASLPKLPLSRPATSTTTVSATQQQNSPPRTFLAIKKLGSGGYSDVFLGHDKKDKEYEYIDNPDSSACRSRVALKISTLQGAAQLQREVGILRELGPHPHLVELINAFVL